MSNEFPELSLFDTERLENLHFLQDHEQQLEDKYHGLFVAIASGKLICVERTFEGAWAGVDNRVPAALHRIVMRVGDTLLDTDDKFGPGDPPPKPETPDEPGVGDGEGEPTAAPKDQIRQQKCPQELTVTADANNEYYIDMIVCGEKVRMLIDTGHTSGSCHSTVAVDKAVWDKIKGKVKNRQARNAGGVASRLSGEGGECEVKIDGLCDKKVTKVVSYYSERKDIVEAGVNIPKSKKTTGNTTVETDGTSTITITKKLNGFNNVGVCFFHQFGGKSEWDQKGKKMTFKAP